MAEPVDAIIHHKAPELIWLLEHPPLYTAGTNTSLEETPLDSSLPLYKTGRGGKITYHGPGQRIIYVMLDLRKRGQDLKKFVFQLEEWIILTLRCFQIEAERRTGRVGIWIKDEQERDQKIAAIGIRVKKWVTYHGIALNLNPDLQAYTSIIPCGIKDAGVTSLTKMQVPFSTQQVDQILKETFVKVFA